MVLGGGMVGRIMAADLAEDFDVTLVDLSQANLDAAHAKFGLKTRQADLSDPAALKALIADQDLVCGALASILGFQTLRAVIEAGKPYCDISFMPEDAIDLDALAKTHGVTAIVDMGVAPGMSNVLAGWGAHRLDRPTNIEIYVGGLPRARHWPFEYKAGFAPYDVIEEYTRPSRIVVDGQLVIKEALSEPELLEFPGIGSLEAFNTDGLRSLASTLDVPNMCEKTMRYPGHIALMAAFRETGLFSHEPVEVRGPGGSATIRPIDLISTLMFPKWTYEEGEEDLTVMRVLVDGHLGDQPTRLQWDLVDFFDRKSMCTSMSRTTALPCATMARLVLDGTVTTHGVIAPELLGAMPGVPEALLSRMDDLGITYLERELPC